MLDIVRDTIRDVVDIKTEGTADREHGRRLRLSHFRNGDTKMKPSKNSQHFAVLTRSNTGSRLEYRMNSDEIELLSIKSDLLKQMLESYFHGFEVEYFEQVGVKNNESDS